jgi:hypothetical protein
MQHPKVKKTFKKHEIRGCLILGGVILNAAGRNTGRQVFSAVKVIFTLNCVNREEHRPVGGFSKVYTGILTAGKFPFLVTDKHLSFNIFHVNRVKTQQLHSLDNISGFMTHESPTV